MIPRACLSVCRKHTDKHVFVCLFVRNTRTNTGNTKIPVFSLFSDSQWSLWPLAHRSWAKWWHNPWQICHVSISHSVQWNTLLLSWGKKRERGHFVCRSTFGGWESSDRGLNCGLKRPSPGFEASSKCFNSIQLYLMNWIEFKLLVSLVIKFWLCKP